MKKRKPSIAIAVLCLLMIPAATFAYAQGENYPAKPVTIITDAPPGSTPDVVARFVAGGLGHPGASRWLWSLVRAPTAVRRRAQPPMPRRTDIRCSCRRYRRSWPRSE